MSVSHRYRNFGGPKPSPKSDDDNAESEMEDLKLQAFETGYQAGWDDALKAQEDAKKKLSEELSQALQDISFSYREAISKVSGSMQPVMQEIVEKLLPEIVRAGLSAHIVEQLKTMIGEQIDQSIEIVVAKENVEMVKSLVREHLKQGFKVVSDKTVGKGQAFIRVEDTERQVDLDGVVAGVADAMTAFFHEATQEPDNE